MSHTINHEATVIRKKIVSMLSTLFKMTIPESYKLSRESGTDYGYELTFKTMNGNWKKIGETLINNFPGLKVLTSDNQRIFFNTQKCIVNDNSIENDEVSMEEPEEAQERRTFLKEIAEIISGKIYFGNEFPGKITKHGGNKNIALVEFPASSNGEFFETIDYFFWKSFKFLQKNKGTLIVFKDASFVAENELPVIQYEQKLQESSDLLNKLDELIKNIIIYLNPHIGSPNFKRMTRVGYLAFNDLQARVEYQINDSEEAHKISEVLFELNLVSSKNGSMVYLEVKPDLILQIDAKWISFLERIKVNKNVRGIIIQEKIATEGENYKIIVHYTYDYKRFHFLPFNRKPDQRHVNYLGVFIEEFSMLDFVLIARTDCIDGEMKDWIIDRQHRFLYLEKTHRPIPYVILIAHSKRELIRLVAALNSSSKKWSKKDYLNAWKTMQMEEYKIIEHWNKNHHLPITTILIAMTGLDTKQINKAFETGDLLFKQKEKGEIVLNQLVQMKKLIPRGIKYKYGTIKFLLRVKDREDFCFTKLIESINLKPLNFSPDDREGDIIKRLTERI